MIYKVPKSEWTGAQVRMNKTSLLVCLSLWWYFKSDGILIPYCWKLHTFVPCLSQRSTMQDISAVVIVHHSIVRDPCSLWSEPIYPNKPERSESFALSVSHLTNGGQRQLSYVCLTQYRSGVPSSLLVTFWLRALIMPSLYSHPLPFPSSSHFSAA